MASSGCDWVLLAQGEMTAGDVVSADAGGMPIYRVVSVDDGLALLEDDHHPAPLKLPVSHLRWKLART